jgi:hypothetical protein
MSSNKVESLYYRLNKKIKKNYSFLDQKFKDVKNLFELQFRLLETDQRKVANLFLKKITRPNIIHKNIYRIIIIIYSNLYFFFHKTPSVFMRSKSMSKFAEKKLQADLRYNKIKTLGTVSFSDSLIERLRYIYLNTFIYDILELASEVHYVLKIYKCDNVEKLVRLIKSDIFIKKINTAFKNDKNFISKVLKKFCIRGVLLHTDQTPLGYILIQAAKKININTAILAHGTLADPCLISVLPTHAKKIFVWTKKNEKYINRCAKSQIAELANGIKTNIILRKNTNIILIVGDPYNFNFINKNLEIKFENFIQKLSKKNNSLRRIIYCPHPGDRNIITKKKIINAGLEWSEISTYKAAENAKIIIGGASSFLFESYFSGIPTFQVKEFLNISNKYKNINNKCKGFNDHLKIEKIPQLTYKEFLNNYEKIIMQKLNMNNMKFDAQPFINYYKL